MEVIVTGRQSTSLTREIGKAVPTVFTKAGAVSVAAFGGRFYNLTKHPLKVLRAHASVGTAPTGASLIVDVKINGTSVYAAAGDRPTITATNFASNVNGNAPTKTDLDDLLVLPGQYVTVEATQVGSTVAGSDATVQVYLG
jgi:hypothetical protein